MIHNVNMTATLAAIPAAVKVGFSDAMGTDKTVQATWSNTDTASMSTLSRQLGESAVRAEARYKSMSREQLGELGKKTVDHFLGSSYTANKVQHDAEVPKSDDPALIERARKATIYVNKSQVQDPSAQNPFARLSREQAVLIAYDDKGPYTVNERHAAWTRAADLEQQWRTKAVTRGMDEYSSCGRMPKFMKECLDHYKALPAIEQAQYDLGYEGRLYAGMKEQSGAGRNSDRQLNLYEILAGIQLPEKKREETAPVKYQNFTAKKNFEPVQAGVATPSQPSVSKTSS